MKKFYVQVIAEYYRDYEIEAESQEEAEEIAIEIFCKDVDCGWDSIESRGEVYG